jgi:hypothetical protein
MDLYFVRSSENRQVSLVRRDLRNQIEAQSSKMVGCSQQDDFAVAWASSPAPTPRPAPMLPVPWPLKEWLSC